MAEEIKENPLDPKQVEFLKHYLNPKDECFGNAYKSGIKSGYEESYAENIMSLMPKWLSENIEDLRVLKKAEKRLNETLDLETKNGDKIDSNLLRIVVDVAKFIAERLGKNKYSTKTELEHSGSIDQNIKADDKIIDEFYLWRKQKDSNPPKTND